MAIPDSTTPTQSMRVVVCGSLGMACMVCHSPMAAMGRLMKKMECQPKWSMHTPPRMGPMRVAAPDVALHSPRARPRSCGGNSWVMSVIDCGAMSADPSPWHTRKAMSMPTLMDSPLPKEAKVKTSIPMTKTRRVPNRSPRRPEMMRGMA